MMGVRWAVVAAMGCLAGCYRYAEVPLDQVKAMESGAEGRSLKVEREGGMTQRFADYDHMVVEVASYSEHDDELELATPLRVELDHKRLRLSTRESIHEVARADVRSLTLRQDAGGRPYLIVGIALGAMILGGVVAGNTSDCSGEDFCGYERLARGLVGSTVGLGLGLGLAIPLTGKLSPERTGPTPEE